jgi:hypothetical protein
VKTLHEVLKASKIKTKKLKTKTKGSFQNREPDNAGLLVHQTGAHLLVPLLIMPVTLLM